MSEVLYTKRFDAAPDRVYAALTDIERWPEMISGITAVEMITEGPVGVGTRFRETRRMMGKDRSEEMEVTAIDPGKGFTIGCQSCGCDMRFVHRLKPDGSGTRFELESNTRAISLMAKITMPLMSAMMKKSMIKCMDKDYQDIERYLAGDGGPGADTAPA